MNVELIVDDVQVTAEAGESVLDVARHAGRDIPALCHHEAVPTIASCRLCLMEVRRPGRDWVQLTTSCDYPVSAGLVVVTDSARIRKHRAMNLELLLRRAPDAPVLRQLAAQLDVTEPRFAPVTDAPLPDCILCELCVRVCSALGYNALAAIGRGAHKSVGPPFGQMEAPDCVGCGSCYEACPTACIPMEDTATTRAIWGRTFELLACERCGRPITTEAHAATMAAKADLPVKSDHLCDVCKRRIVSERLASPGR
ncbi:MAG: 2Fe-2S iron-sulfur cluster-binding protein [Actinobacteria bacterium]|nr:2Fe-2S iron-sulfur cluster-binding protein [Actinomycetota bacterium]